MDIFLFFIALLVVGLGIAYFRGRLPKAKATFLFVFSGMCLLYWGSVLFQSF